MQTLPPTDLATIIGSSLEPALFELVLEALGAETDEMEEEKKAVASSMEQVKRFELVRGMVDWDGTRWAGVARR